MKDPKEILAQAENASRSVESWADLWNLLFAPETGLVSKAYPTPEEREFFLKTKEHKAIRELVIDAMRHFGLAEGATPRKSGRFVVRLPKSLHERLEFEASIEGVSLNQLVVYKLSSQLGTFTGTRQAPRKTLRATHTVSSGSGRRKLQVT